MTWLPGPPPPLEPLEYFSVITRLRIGYHVDLCTNMTALHRPYWRPTRRWAEAKARRLLARKRAEPESWTVT